jgi:hypothetical protein
MTAVHQLTSDDTGLWCLTIDDGGVILAHLDQQLWWSQQATDGEWRTLGYGPAAYPVGPEWDAVRRDARVGSRVHLGVTMYDAGYTSEGRVQWIEKAEETNLLPGVYTALLETVAARDEQERE